MRGLINQLTFFESDVRFLHSRGTARLRRILFVSVDGEAAQDTSVAMKDSVGGVGTIFGAVSGAQIDRYNFETLSLARLKLADFVGRLKKVRCGTAVSSTGIPAVTSRAMSCICLWRASRTHRRASGWRKFRPASP